MNYVRRKDFCFAEFNKFGMRYGWLGRQAILCVDSTIGVKNYNAFVEFGKEFNNLQSKKLSERQILDFIEDLLPEPG